MDIFEKIGDKISTRGKDVAKKAKDMTELARLNSKVRSYEDMIKEVHLAIGKMYFESNMSNPAPEYMEMFQKIINAQGAIEKCKEEIYSIKGVRTCVKCDAEIPNNSTFCPSCGTRNDIIDVSYTDAAAESEILCPSCGIHLPSDTVFCSNCGTKVNE